MSSTAAFFDNFTRADNADLGVNWDAGYTGGITFQLVSNRVRSSATSSAALESVNAIADMADTWVQFLVATFTGADVEVMGGRARMTAPATNTFYEVNLVRNTGTATTDINKQIAGASTNLATENATAWAAGDVVRLEVQGTALRVYRNGSLLLSATDGAIASGRIGAAIFVNTGGSLANAELDDFQGGPMGDATILAPRTRPFPFRPGSSRTRR